MFCVKLLFLVSFLTLLVNHNCQDYDGAVESWEPALYWICKPGGEDYDDTYKPEGVCNYAYSITPPPGQMSANMRKMPIFPDLTCHPDINDWIGNLGEYLKTMFYNCMHDEYNHGTPWPHFDMDELEEKYDWSTCPKMCMLTEKGLDLTQQDWPKMEDTQKYRRKFLFKNDSWNLGHIMGEDLGNNLATKINLECQEKLSKVFEIERDCNHPVALELYDCVNAAVAC